MCQDVKRQVYMCPNCGRTYAYGVADGEEVMFQCMNCNYPLKKPEDIKKVRNPVQYKVIGEVSDTASKVTCPYCKSTSTSKIGSVSKAADTLLFGIFGTKRHKQWHCNRCGSDF